MQSFPNREALAQALARDVAAAVSARLAVQVEAMVAVSGGTTPALFFAALSQADLDWSRVIITLVDERWVPEESGRSNAALVRRHLLINNAAAAQFVPLYNGASSPQSGRDALAAQFAQLPLSLAAAVLGMGEDGHTASFFPGGDRLAMALAPAQGQSFEVINAPNAVEPRITLTLPALLTADLLALHIEGERKHEVLGQALSEGPVEAMPVRAVLRHNPKIYWSP